jgi:hypothetical protein
VAFSQQANNTNQATAACQQSYCQILGIEGVACSAQQIPTAVNLGFLDHNRYFSPFKYILNYPHKAQWTPFQIHCFSENVVEPGIEPGTFGSVARNSNHQTTEAANRLLQIRAERCTTILSIHKLLVRLHFSVALMSFYYEYLLLKQMFNCINTHCSQADSYFSLHFANYMSYHGLF